MTVSALLANLSERRASALLIVTGVALLALCPVMLHCLVQADDCEYFAWLAFAQGAVYALGVWIVLQRRFGRPMLLVILAVATMARLTALPAPPTLSTDLYRYVWDGRVQGAGINPYLHVPADPQLAPLRDQAVYPNINRADYAPTIYPPVAQMLFLGVTRVSESLWAMKLAMFAFDLVTIALIMAILRRDGRPPHRVLIYAWHPLPIWEFSGAGHVDAAAIALMCLGVLLALCDRRWAAGATLALSVLIKPFALVITPALWRRWDWRMPVAFVATAALCYLPYLGAGAKLLGFLGGYRDEEGYRDGWGFFPVALLQALGLPAPSGTVYVLIALVALAALAAAVTLRQRPTAEIAPEAAVLLATTFILLVSPHYAWYFAWVLPLLCRVVYAPLIYVTLASFAFYLDEIIGEGAYLKAGLVLYGGFMVLAVIDLMTRQKQSPVRRPA
jgi:alpha-1,6-mannosyltransferase